MLSQQRIEDLIRLCQKQAKLAIQEGNVPIGAVLVDPKGKVIAKNHNTQNTTYDPTAHAEMNVLRELGLKYQTRHFDEYNFIMFGNAEPCSMCVSACIKDGIRSFYYGAPAEPTMDPWVAD